MTSEHRSPEDVEACAACWESMVDAARSGGPPASSASRHIEECPSCRRSAPDAVRLGQLLSALSEQVHQEVSRCGPLLSDRRTPDALIGMARSDLWVHWAKRACEASMGIAAAVAIVCGILVSGAPAPLSGSRDRTAPQAQLVLVDRQAVVAQDTVLRDSPASAAIPVQGWIDLPPKEMSPDSLIWWVVLSYGAQR